MNDKRDAIAELKDNIISRLINPQELYSFLYNRAVFEFLSNWNITGASLCDGVMKIYHFDLKSINEVTVDLLALTAEGVRELLFIAIQKPSLDNSLAYKRVIHITDTWDDSDG